ncbi:putative syringomycin synthetase [Mycobacterium xenopi 4042]|uniref:Putative syringomycin synthetase n=1 Tax=Mycobacterium xenopi 4042 TaxID=1299334 RepID=X8DK62_MYCXE|nr:putative syringomycin synthetase [Mycobacterium xenopi 4042]
MIVSPASDLQAIAGYIEAERQGSKRPTFASVHGRAEEGEAVEVRARDLRLDKFLDARTLEDARPCPGQAPRCARCCSPARPDSWAATWRWSGWSGWTPSTAR